MEIYTKVRTDSESTVRARIDSEIKTLVESNLQKMGLTPSTAIRLFYIAIAEQGKLPFEVRVPKEETLQSFRDIKVLLARVGSHTQIFKKF